MTKSEKSRGKLEMAALELFAERTYEGTTIAQIAERAGLQERSFYRHYRDKRDVVFGGHRLQDHLVAAIDEAPAELAPFDTLIAAFEAIEEILRTKEYLLARRQVIAANPALRERELLGFASVAAALTDALTRRGIEPTVAELTADIGMTNLRLATERWLAADDADFAATIRATAAEILAALPTVAPNLLAAGNIR